MEFTPEEIDTLIFMVRGGIERARVIGEDKQCRNPKMWLHHATVGKQVLAKLLAAETE